MKDFKEKVKNIPEVPGVYVMLDCDGVVIYVGKAKILKNRVKQYFYNSVKNNKVMAMVENVADFYYLVAASEQEALSLECNLIKKYKPKYNILLKDDKYYPYLKINLKDDFPIFKITRRITDKSSKYFGPFMGVSVRDILEIITLAFSLRTCDTKINGRQKRECLNYHIGRCLAPCTGRITREDYMKNVSSAVEFLSGDDALAKAILTEKMTKCSDNEEFELAARYRDMIFVVDKLMSKRITSLNRFINADMISTASDGIYSTISILITRAGKMVGGKNFVTEDASLDACDRISEFITRYYADGGEVPDEIVVPINIDFALLEDYIYNTRGGKKPSILFAKQGVRKQLLDMATANAEEYLSGEIEKVRHKEDMTTLACKRLKDILSLSRYPKRIECYDISNISGVDKVGSMVVFTDGVADKDEYRRFKIKTVEGANDFASLKEVLSRRIERMINEDEKFPKPDLVVIDGGKGQLSSVAEVFNEKNVTNIDLISLAKREEEIYTLFSEQPIALSHSDYALRLLMRLRDEAHRYAITYFRSVHTKRNLGSLLTEIEGIGKKRRKLLLEKFKSIDVILAATEEELATTDGIGAKQAKLIYEFFQKNKWEDKNE